MAKITYFLGAGASFGSCPILQDQAEEMINLAKSELNRTGRYKDPKGWPFTDSEKTKFIDKKDKVLWYIGYFGTKAKEFNTVDTYAKKLHLSEQFDELNLLKMAVSVFFDLWESFPKESFRANSSKEYKAIDYRYITLFSILLEKSSNKISLNTNFKFITWNYDLQLEGAYQRFLKENQVWSYNQLDDLHLKFSENEDLEVENDIYHLNGYRGFYRTKDSILEMGFDVKYSDYWNHYDGLYDNVNRKNVNFNNHLKYAWEHNLESNWFKKIAKTFNETEVLVIIGYSFPPFNRKIDQFLFNQLNSDILKEIVYQDPNANKDIILNLFSNSTPFEEKIKIEKEKENLLQFHIPNSHFITQVNKPKHFFGA
jgi:hypothetical protein